jgi:hypothetical protein
MGNVSKLCDVRIDRLNRRDRTSLDRTRDKLDRSDWILEPPGADWILGFIIRGGSFSPGARTGIDYHTNLK